MREKGRIIPNFDSYNPKIAELFKRYDLNRDGRLEKHELCNGLGELIKSIEPDLDDETLEQIIGNAIEKFDLNQNGTIEIDEFDKLIQFLVEEKGLILNNI